MSSTKSENGYCYNINTGVFEGTISTSTGDKNRVFACTGLTKDNRFINPQKIELTHEEFQICANIIAYEAGTATEECIYCAFAASNWEKRLTSKTLYTLLRSSYSSVEDKHKVPAPDTPVSDKTLNEKYNLARKGLLQAQLGYPDPTGGATHWDGTDFLAWGLKNPDGKKHPKFTQYKKITIKKSLYDYYLKETLKKHPTKQAKYDGKLFSIPAEIFLDPKNWTTGDFVYNTGTPKSVTQTLTAVSAKGHTIFWKAS